MLITLIPLIDSMAPFGELVDRIALVFFNNEKAIKTSCTMLDSRKKLERNVHILSTVL